MYYKNKILKIGILIICATGLAYISYPHERKEYDFSAIILQQEKKALQGDKAAIFSVFGYYIVTEHDYSAANDFFLDLSEKGYKKEAIEIIEYIANADEFKNNEIQLSYLNNAVDRNITLAKEIQNYIKNKKYSIGVK